jgi:hypothetical protein|nr:MAG TPA: hypothetical protein [Caudoviricetes sp.]
MTNREYIIAQLSNKGFIDDNGASYESAVGDMIACPYYCGDERALCVNKEGKEIDRTCFECKENWLNSEVSE